MIWNATSLTEYRNDNILDTPISNIGILKSIIAYGANSSGKSNFFKAIRFVKKFIQNSSKDSQANEEINTEAFRLSLETINEPSFFEIEIIHNKAKYRYGFEVDNQIVHREWLFFMTKNKEYSLFEREYQNIVIGSKYDKSSENIIENTRENALFLSVCAQLNVSMAIDIIKELSNLKYISGTSDRATMDFTVKLLNDSNYTRIINNFISGAKLGFNKVETEKIEITKEMLNKSGIPKDLHKAVLENSQNTIITTEHIVYDKNLKPNGLAYFDLLSNESLEQENYFLWLAHN